LLILNITYLKSKLWIMKKFTIILSCLVATVGIMNGQSVSDLPLGTTPIKHSKSPTIITSERGSAAIIS
jgi:hypothetical protein